MNKTFITVGAILAGLSVLLGAFWAHVLKESLSVTALMSFETGVKYQMYHGLTLLILGVIPVNSDKLQWSFRGFFFGTILFSGSIYCLSLDELLNLDLSYMGPITPIGGLFLIAGWLMLVVNVVKSEG